MLFRGQEPQERRGLVPLDPILEHNGLIVIDVARGEQQRDGALAQSVLERAQ
jgi:hypothetical protein